MRWSIRTPLAEFIVDLAVSTRRAEQAKDLEIALQRHQPRLLPRRSPRMPRLSRWEELAFAVLAAKLSRLTERPRAQLSRAVLLIQPETVLRTGAPHVDLPASARGRPATHRCRGGVAAPAPGCGEPARGLRPTPGRVDEARPSPRSLDGPGCPEAAARTPGTAAWPPRQHGATIPRPASRCGPRLRLLHRRDGVPQDAVRALLPRGRDAAGPFAGCTAHPTAAWVTSRRATLPGRSTRATSRCAT